MLAKMTKAVVAEYMTKANRPQPISRTDLPGLVELESGFIIEF